MNADSLKKSRADGNAYRRLNEAEMILASLVGNYGLQRDATGVYHCTGKLCHWRSNSATPHRDGCMWRFAEVFLGWDEAEPATPPIPRMVVQGGIVTTH